jgi:tRNA-intron endonuclease
MATIVGDRIIEDDQKQILEFHERGFGEIHGGLLALAPVEAIYLTEIKKISIIKEGNEPRKGAAGSKKTYGVISLFTELKKHDKEIATKYYVYRDLRKRGYVVRTGLKFGTYFRVYEKGIRVGEGHSQWLVHPIQEQKQTSIYELARAVRLSHSVRKKMLWAVVDSEGDVTYYKIERIIP